MVVLEVVDALPLDGLLEDLRLAATELLPHLHQPGGDGAAEGWGRTRVRRRRRAGCRTERGSRGRWRRRKRNRWQRKVKRKEGRGGRGQDGEEEKKECRGVKEMRE